MSGQGVTGYAGPVAAAAVLLAQQAAADLIAQQAAAAAHVAAVAGGMAGGGGAGGGGGGVAVPAAVAAVIAAGAAAPAAVIAPYVPPLLDLEFDAALMNIGFNQGTREALGEQGYCNIADLLELANGDFDKISVHITKQHPIDKTQPADPVHDVKFMFRSMQTLKVMRHWHAQKVRTGEPGNAALFSGAVIVAAKDRMMEEEEIVKALKGVEVVKPKPLKDLKDWRTFKESFENFTSQRRGAALISPSYVFRMDAVETQEARLADDYADEDARLMARTLLSGKHYSIDNKMIFDELESLTAAGPAWVFIKKFKKKADGRAAMLALQVQSEGISVISTRRDAAKKMLRETVYAGVRRNFSFADYINKFQRAYNELSELGEVPSDASMVTDFMTGITDPGMVTAKTFVIGSPLLRENWNDTQQFFLSFVQSMMVSLPRATSTRDRDVSAVGTDGRGRGRTGGRGGRNGGGRGNGGRGRGGDRSSDSGTYTGKIHSGNYPIAIWRSLDSDQKAKVQELRDAEKGGDGEKINDKDVATKKRGVSSVETLKPGGLLRIITGVESGGDEATDVMTMESPTKQPRITAPPTVTFDDTTTHLFGRGTYKRTPTKKDNKTDGTVDAQPPIDLERMD